LLHISRFYPQSIIYHLIGVYKSKNQIKKVAMQKILENIKQQNPTLVNEAILIAEEVNRVAVLLYESWYLSIEEAWRLYSEERKIEKVLALL